MGEQIGFMVVTQEPDGKWHADWDGLVHESRATADRELAEAVEAGYTAQVVELTTV
jgi:hypothetical protein